MQEDAHLEAAYEDANGDPFDVMAAAEESAAIAFADDEDDEDDDDYSEGEFDWD